MNKGASIKARLLNISKRENIAFQVVIFRFLHERFLFRLSKSRFQESFYLKGGSLLYAFQNEMTRPTKDVDLLGFNIENDSSTILLIFQEITQIEDDDAVWFDSQSIRTELIKEDEKYEGVRLFIEGGFDSVKNRIQIDIGFGDIIFPKSEQIHYPLLLNDLSPIKIQSYSKESIIAEKLHAILVLSYSNSRMKDFYDIYGLILKNQFDENSLQGAILATFNRRETPIPENPTLFTAEFGADKNLNLLWSNFLKKNNLSLTLEFKDIVEKIKKEFEPIFHALTKS
jgi:predicted nucleotidyltransferase component of viral defense system